MDPKAKILVVSDMNFGPYTLKAITKEEIKEVIECYGAAAERAVKAGYDCLEFHLAHNYLPHSFLSAGLNHREDEYGGSFENRCRFPLEVIDELRKRMPEGMPLFIRIDAQDNLLENGMSIEEVIRFCKIAKEHGVDVLDVSRGNIITAASMYEVPPIDVPNAFNVENAARIRKETGMVTVGVGRINTAALAEELIADDKVDMVVMGRAQLADPEFANKAKEGHVEDIVHCVGCNQGCYDGFCDVVNRPHITCMRNPMIGHEAEYTLDPAEYTKKVWVIGGGLVGLETADTLASAGCEVTILEMKDSIGSDFGSLRKIAVMMKMQQLNVKMLTNSKVCKFTEEGIVLEDGTVVPCSCAVFAVGFHSNDSHLLAEACEKKQIPFHVIGDAKAARRAIDAVAEGFEVGRQI